MPDLALMAEWHQHQICWMNAVSQRLCRSTRAQLLNPLSKCEPATEETFVSSFPSLQRNSILQKHCYEISQLDSVPSILSSWSVWPFLLPWIIHEWQMICKAPILWSVKLPYCFQSKLRLAICITALAPFLASYSLELTAKFRLAAQDWSSPSPSISPPKSGNYQPFALSHIAPFSSMVLYLSSAFNYDCALQWYPPCGPLRCSWQCPQMVPRPSPL